VNFDIHHKDMPEEARPMPGKPLKDYALSYTIDNDTSTASVEVLLKGSAFNIKRSKGMKVTTN
jgi:hypothetical protein